MICARVFEGGSSMSDYANSGIFGDGEDFSIGSRRMKWLYTPHVPHGWDCGIMFDLTTKTLLCGDLFHATWREHAAGNRIGSAHGRRRHARDDGHAKLSQTA